MSDALQVHIHENLKDDLFFQPFQELLNRESWTPYDPESLNMDQTVLVLAHQESFEQVRQRFRYFRQAWYLLFSEEETHEAPRLEKEQVFLLHSNEQSAFESVFSVLKKMAESKTHSQRSLEAPKDHLRLMTEAYRHLDWLTNEQKPDFIGSDKARDEAWQELDHFLWLRREIYQAESLSEGLAFIRDRLAPFGLLDVQVCSDQNIFERMDHRAGRLILPHPIQKEQASVHFDYRGAFDAQKAMFIYLLYQEIEKFLVRDPAQSAQFYDNSLWETAFSHIKTPLLLLSNSADVIVHNQEFSRLKILPKDCLSLTQGQQVELNRQYWQVFVSEVLLTHGVGKLIVFRGTGANEAQIGGLSSSELGIISGSLAHELNNPVGGILAALSLLELEEGWDQEELASLADMKSSAMRCKSLIEIFLGFSRLAPASLDRPEQRKAFEQALNLLRFRMIESQTRMDIHQYHQSSEFQKIVNSSVMAMIYYLLLSEVLTHYSQWQLISEADPTSRILMGEFYETDQTIVIQFNEPWTNQPPEEMPKLLTHLLSLEGIALEVERTRLKLHRSTLI